MAKEDNTLFCVLGSGAVGMLVGALAFGKGESKKLVAKKPPRIDRPFLTPLALYQGAFILSYSPGEELGRDWLSNDPGLAIEDVPVDAVVETTVPGVVSTFFEYFGDSRVLRIVPGPYPGETNLRVGGMEISIRVGAQVLEE